MAADACGGEWRGHLFENPHTGLPEGLTWGFVFDLPDKQSLTVEWVPLPGAEWRAMAGQSARCEVFGEPIESSVYCFEHYCYDAVDLRILEQDGTRLRVAADISGDVDGLGIPSWSVDDWLEFDAITVQLPGVDTVDAAAERLGAYLDISGLTPTGENGLVKFR